MKKLILKIKIGASDTFFLKSVWLLITKHRKINFKKVKTSYFPELTQAWASGTQGQSIGLGEKAGRKFSSTGKRTPGYRLSPNYFQKFKRMPAPY